MSNESAIAEINQSVTQRQRCAHLSTSYPETGASVFEVNVVLTVVNVILCLCATIMNALVIIATWKNDSLHSPTNILLCSLASSDLMVGVLAQSSYAASKIAEINRDFKVFCVTFTVADFSAWIAVGASIGTLTEISLERCIAVMRPLRYNALVTTQKVWVAVAFAWIIPILFQCLRYWILSRETFTVVIFTTVFTCIVATTAAYSFLWNILRHHRNQVSNQVQLQVYFHGQDSVDMTRKRKSVVTMVYVYVLFLLSCIPTLYAVHIYNETAFQFTAHSSNLWGISSTLAFANSSLNPLVYCWRMTNIRRAIRDILRNTKQQLCPSAQDQD